jgi:unsaturated chondroitin disaccharide hydrolase
MNNETYYKILKIIYRLLKISCIVILFFTLIHPSNFESLNAQNLDSLVIHSLHFSEEQLANTVNQLTDTTLYPYRTHDNDHIFAGIWILNTAGSWVSGWFPGCLWYMYQWTKHDIWRSRAEKWTDALENSQYKTNSHDVGFIIFCSFGNGYRLTGKNNYRDIIIQAASSLSTRYHSRVGCIESWNRYEQYKFPVIIDNMMNLEILFWAAKNGGESAWYDMAVSHSMRTMQDHVREDGSTYQIVAYDTTTGEVLKKLTKQGFDNESTWARGQAWGMYGFTMAYRETGDERFLNTAQKLSDFFISNLPGDFIPNWDFDFPDTLKDVSAAAIASSALLELSILSDDQEDQEKYKDAAFNILKSLCSPEYLAEGTNCNGILLHGIQNYNDRKGMDVSLIYADYYFIEAMLRYLDYIDKDQQFPATVHLFQNYPNPFNANTTIWYKLPYDTEISLQVYDLRGRLVEILKKSFQTSGEYRIPFYSTGLASGTYFILLQTGDNQASRKMTLIR